MSLDKFSGKTQRPRNFKRSDQGTFPDYTAVAGVTFDTAGTTVTLSSWPQQVLESGDFLYSSSNNQIIRIAHKNANMTLTLEEAFLADVSGDALRYVKREDVNFRSLGVANSGTAGPTVVNGMDFELTDYPMNWNEEEGLDPVAYDASGANEELHFTVGY